MIKKALMILLMFLASTVSAAQVDSLSVNPEPTNIPVLGRGEAQLPNWWDTAANTEHAGGMHMQASYLNDCARVDGYHHLDGYCQTMTPGTRLTAYTQSEPPFDFQFAGWVDIHDLGYTMLPYQLTVRPVHKVNVKVSYGGGLQVSGYTWEFGSLEFTAVEKYFDNGNTNTFNEGWHERWYFKGHITQPAGPYIPTCEQINEVDTFLNCHEVRYTKAGDTGVDISAFVNVPDYYTHNHMSWAIRYYKGNDDWLSKQPNPSPAAPTVYAQDRGGLRDDIPHFLTEGEGKDSLPNWWDKPLIGKEETGSLEHAQTINPDLISGLSQTIPGPSVYRDDLYTFCNADDHCIYGMRGGIYKDKMIKVNGTPWFFGDPMHLNTPEKSEGPKTLRFAGWIDVNWEVPSDQGIDYRLHVFPYLRVRYYRQYKCGSLGGINLESQSFGPGHLPLDSGTVLSFKWLASEKPNPHTDRWYFEGSVMLDPNTDWLDCEDTSWGSDSCSCIGIDQTYEGGPKAYRWGVEWSGEFHQCCSANPAGKIYHDIRFFVEEDQPNEDVNLDGQITGLDLAAIKAPGTWMKTTSEALNPRADVNHDGQINGLDLAAIKNKWQQTN